MEKDVTASFLLFNSVTSFIYSLFPPLVLEGYQRTLFILSNRRREDEEKSKTLRRDSFHIQSRKRVSHRIPVKSVSSVCVIFSLSLLHFPGRGDRREEVRERCRMEGWHTKCEELNQNGIRDERRAKDWRALRSFLFIPVRYIYLSSCHPSSFHILDIHHLHRHHHLNSILKDPNNFFLSQFAPGFYAIHAVTGIPLKSSWTGRMRTKILENPSKALPIPYFPNYKSFHSLSPSLSLSFGIHCLNRSFETCLIHSWLSQSSTISIVFQLNFPSLPKVGLFN